MVSNSVPAISFLLCTRNRAETVLACVRHLLSSPRQDFEVIVRDNCSTDDTLSVLREIRDSRLSIHVASENQGTRTFYEISRLAAGEIVTWLSDEDNFQFDMLDHVLATFRQKADCAVLFGGIVVGESARRVVFKEETVHDAVQACIMALSFSGCGGLFVRRAALAQANCFDVRNNDDAYALWNYYPVGFFASRGVTGTLVTTSRVAVVQSRFARTTNNWSQLSPAAQVRLPHYYPESVFERLASNIINVSSKRLPWRIRLRVAGRLIRLFFLQLPSFSDPAVYALLRENYPDQTVQAYLAHIERHGLDTRRGQQVWAVKMLLFSLPAELVRLGRHWRTIGRTEVNCR